MCDGIHDCPNGEDEEKDLCGAVPTCNNQTHFACSEPPATTLAPAPAPAARPGVHAVVTHLPFDLDDLAAGFSCIPRRHVCDGRVDCVAGDGKQSSSSSSPAPGLACGGLCPSPRQTHIEALLYFRRAGVPRRAELHGQRRLRAALPADGGRARGVRLQAGLPAGGRRPRLRGRGRVRRRAGPALPTAVRQLAGLLHLQLLSGLQAAAGRPQL